MFVKDRMTKDVATVYPEDSVSKAFQVLVERGYSQLPVIDKNGRLIGLVTEKLLSEVSPSKATSLSVFELNYLLTKTLVKDIMKTDIFTIGPLALIEEAAHVMKTNDISSLPVILEDSKLEGIVTRLDIFGAFIEIMGVNDTGARITINVNDVKGVLAKVAGIIESHGINITHISNFIEGETVELVIRMGTSKIEGLIEDLKKSGYNVTSVIAYE